LSNNLMNNIFNFIIINFFFYSFPLSHRLILLIYHALPNIKVENIISQEYLRDTVHSIYCIFSA
jgi:hypothetical protein